MCCSTKKKKHSKHHQNKEDSAANGSGHQSANGLISNSKCVLRGHQSPIVAIALQSELDICVSCSSQGLILIHTVQHGEYRHSLYLSGDICGRGASLSNLQFKHIPDGAREYPSELDRVTGNEAHPDIRQNPFDITSHGNEHHSDIGNADNGSGSDMDLSSRVDLMFTRFGVQEDEQKGSVANTAHSQSSLMSASDWGDRCQIDIVRISREGTIVMLSKSCNVIFTCNINGMNWNSLKVTDNLTTIDIDRTGKLLLTAGQCGTAKIRHVYNLSRNVYKFQPVGDSITIARFDRRNNRVFIGTESGSLFLFALPHLNRIRSIIDTLCHPQG